jgi:hypothetical protein
MDNNKDEIRENVSICNELLLVVDRCLRILKQDSIDSVEFFKRVIADTMCNAIQLIKHKISLKAYILRSLEPGKFQLADGTAWTKHRCAVCGHHMPVDQCLQVEDDFVHCDIRICLALTKKGGNKL